MFGTDHHFHRASRSLLLLLIHHMRQDRREAAVAKNLPLKRKRTNIRSLLKAEPTRRAKASNDYCNLQKSV